MSRNKPSGKKNRLGKAMNSNKAIPAWVILRTGAKLKTNPLKRNWRRSKLKV
ncbi:MULTISPECIES: 50S ribosomal protein L39e [Acidianus]|uniref:Large ribosomal subunit protein eL39 n=1 Tax=Candidatus Acidianus copahuensis TaxID=1160895 RepID=A0A031LMP6_9CREN|nr:MULTISPECIES: 50S ribosomal protein L39e [Acidianus]EZQ06903.1 50S ribosomal protein L39 [Candidatus Acidianus copahuensis]NON61399.1 50S ribosomal protein L39e [Acidianus sp. RZ1]